MPTPTWCKVETATGALAVAHWPADTPAAPTVLAVHGIASNALQFQWLADRLAGSVALVAPDLRGRGASADLPGPYGLDRHAEDLAAVTTAIPAVAAGYDDARLVVLGHSMGAFVAARFTTALSRPVPTVLVDGGIPFAVPDPGATRAFMVEAITRRAHVACADVDAYVAFYREWAHGALGPAWTANLDAYARHDAAGTPPTVHSSCAVAAITADAADLFTHGPLPPGPTWMIWADQRSPGEGEKYHTEYLAPYADRMTLVHAAGHNHYSVIMSEPGSALVADTLTDALRP